MLTNDTIECETERAACATSSARFMACAFLRLGLEESRHVNKVMHRSAFAFTACRRGAYATGPAAARRLRGGVRAARRRAPGRNPPGSGRGFQRGRGVADKHEGRISHTYSHIHINTHTLALAHSSTRPTSKKRLRQRRMRTLRVRLRRKQRLRRRAAQPKRRRARRRRMSQRVRRSRRRLRRTKSCPKRSNRR